MEAVLDRNRRCPICGSANLVGYKGKWECMDCGYRFKSLKSLSPHKSLIKVLITVSIITLLVGFISGYCLGGGLTTITITKVIRNTITSTIEKTEMTTISLPFTLTETITESKIFTTVSTITVTETIMITETVPKHTYPIETYEVRVFPGTYVNVLIPPDASVLSMEIVSQGGGNFEVKKFEYLGTFHLRSYKFARARLLAEGGFKKLPWDYAYVTLRVKVMRNATNYIPASKGDELADGLIHRLIEIGHPLQTIRGVTSFLFFTGNSFGNLEKAQEWRGYPILPVSKKKFELPDVDVDYVIITCEKFVPALHEFELWLRERGLRPFTITVEKIGEIYEGATLQDKIKEFLKDAFNKWHMYYVLIVGGVNTVPPIKIWKESKPLPSGETITDFYYMLLEQPANGTCCDLPDLIIGRMPSDDINEVKNMLKKTIMYEKEAKTSEWIRRKVIVFGSSMPREGVDWVLKYCCDENTLRLTYPENLTLSSLTSLLDEGIGSILMSAHAFPLGWELTPTEWLDYGVAASLKNKRPPIVFSEGCFSGKFDDPNSVAIKLLANPDGGAVAIVAGTWYTPYGIEVSYLFYNCAEPVANYHLGKAFYYFVTLHAFCNDHMILLGDPSLSLPS